MDNSTILIVDDDVNLLDLIEGTLKVDKHHVITARNGHEGIAVAEVARRTAEVADDELINYMLNQRTGCMGPGGEDIEQDADDFAALLIYRLGRMPSDRSSIVQVRLGEAYG